MSRVGLQGGTTLCTVRPRQDMFHESKLTSGEMAVNYDDPNDSQRNCDCGAAVGTNHTSSCASQR